jgi:hypothetical protein
LLYLRQTQWLLVGMRFVLLEDTLREKINDYNMGENNELPT